MPDVIESIDAAGGASTTYTLAIGQTAQGSISTLGDHDWFRVDLVAGQTYTFALVGTGSSGVRDPLLSLRGPDGTTIVASNDDGLPNNNSVFTYTATVTGTYYIDVGAFNNGGAGQYGVSVAAGSRATVDAQMGAGIIDAYTASGDFEFSWSATPGTGATVTVGFRMTNDGLEPNFSQFTPQQMAAVLAILQYYSDVCGLTFNVVNPGGYTDNATILLSNYSEDDSSGGYAQYPGSTAANDQAGNIHINAFENSTTSLPLGSYEFFTLMHEIGHAVGLSHPGLYNAGSGQVITYATHAQFTQDTHQYTVMGYFDESNTTTSFGSYPDTLMLYDIYALQQIYGANTATRSGNTVYGFNSTAGGVYDFTINTDPALCIWDGGGIDTLDCSGYSNSQIISLVAGTFSNIGGFSGNVSIAIGAVIENAVGGSGADTIILSTDNVNNLVNGNGGSDTVYVTYAFGSGYYIQSGSTATNLIIVGVAGTDTLQNVEFVHFSNGTTVSTASLAATAASPPTITSNGGGDTATISVSENTTALTTVTATDPDAGATRTYAIVGGADAALFQINSTTGVLSFIEAHNFEGPDDAGHNNSYVVQVQVTDNTGLTDTQTITVNVTDTYEPPSDFNGDGKSDVLWHRGNDGTLMIFNMDGTHLLAAPTLGPVAPVWHIAGTADFNGDGTTDILWRHDDGTVQFSEVSDNAIQSTVVLGHVGLEWLIA